jgi:hypothetical protein
MSDTPETDALHGEIIAKIGVPHPDSPYHRLIALARSLEYRLHVAIACGQEAVEIAERFDSVIPPSR